MYRILITSMATAAVLATACDRNEPASQTETTSAERTPDMVAPTPEPPMDTQATQAEPPKVETTAADEAKPKSTAKAKAKANRAMKTKPVEAKQATMPEPAPFADDDRALRGDDRSDIDMPLQPWDPPTITGTATITSTEIAPPAEPEGAPAQEGTGYVNRSTTLGSGDSGMYTGGQGTYGGRATWGTGSPSK
jgi:hypothetical protein